MSAPLDSAEIRFRPATKADIPALVVMERTCFADPWSASSFDSLIERDGVIALVAESAASPDATPAIVGYAIAWVVVAESELANLAVPPSHRRLGIGGVLLDTVIAHAAARGARDLYLEVRESNAAAAALYEARGFREVGRRRRYYRRPVEDARILHRALTALDATVRNESTVRA